jgi:hypothetical protein
MIDPSAPMSPGWWFARLLQQLANEQSRRNLLECYYRGDPPLPWGPENSRASFQRFQSKARANWSALIVDAVRERMQPVGFRTGASDDVLGDSEAWRIWQANNLDADSDLVHRAQLSMADAYAIVGGVDDSIGAPLITPEDPRQVTTVADPVNRRRVVAALKVFADDVHDADLAYLYLPGEVWRAVRRRPAGAPSVSLDVGGWEWYDRTPQRLPAPVVPVVRFANRLSLTGASLGEFEDVLSEIDRINLMLLQRLSVAVMQAFRQRAVTGLRMTDAQGNPIDWTDVFEQSPGAVWGLPEGVNLWESGGVDLTPLLESVKADIRDLAAVTRTPMHYLFPDAANGSAEGASMMREGLIFKVNDRNVQTGESWEQVMSLAFLFAGDAARADRRDLEVLWSPPDRTSVAERYSAAAQAQAAGVPWRTIMTEILQFSPQQVARMESERAADVFTTAPVAPAPTFGAPAGP